MEKAVLFTNYKSLATYPEISGYKRIYFGNEFCQRLIPTQKDTLKVLSFTKKTKLKITFLTPFVTDYGIDLLDKLFQLLTDNLSSPEVVINDWGCLDLINEKYPRIQPVLGRLMFKQKRDPRLINFIKEIQPPCSYIDSENRKVIVFPKKLPPALKKAYCQSNIDFSEIRTFLMSYKIKRVEVDNLLHGLLLDLPDDISASIYVPFGYLAITRYCTVSNAKQRKERIAECGKECKKYFSEKTAECMPKTIYRKGNTQFYRNNDLNITKWKKTGIDRLIYEPELPI